MKLYELISQLREMAERGYGDFDVRIIGDGDCPTCGEGENVRGAYAIDNYPDKDIEGVYIMGTQGDQK